MMKAPVVVNLNGVCPSGQNHQFSDIIGKCILLAEETLDGEKLRSENHTPDSESK